MGKEELINKCKNCGAPSKYQYCQLCNIKHSNEIAIVSKYPDDVDKTVEFYILKLIEKFKFHNEIVLSYLYKPINLYIVNRIIEETKHMGYLQFRRVEKIEETTRPPFKRLLFHKARLELIPSVRGLKQDRRWDD